jgi:hypothetical protein
VLFCLIRSITDFTLILILCQEKIPAEPGFFWGLL